MSKSIGLLLTSVIFGGAIAVSVGAIAAEIKYRGEIKKLKEFAKTIEEIEIP